jgi:cell division septation protein DedD
LGEHNVHIRLTMDLIPEVKVVVYREGEAEPSLPVEPKAEAVKAKPIEAKPVEAEPVKVEAVEAKPIKAEAVEAEPVEAEPAEAEPAEVEPAETVSEAETGETAQPSAKA